MELIIPIISAVLSAGSILGAAMWGIGHIKTTAAVLEERVGNLIKSVDTLNGTMKENHIELSRRISRVEEIVLPPEQLRLVIRQEVQKTLAG